MNKIKILSILILLLLIPLAAFSKEKVEEEVYETLEKEAQAPVIVILKDQDNKIESIKEEARENKKEIQQVLEQLEVSAPISLAQDSNSELALDKQFLILGGFSANITQEGLEKLEENPLVDKVYYNYPVTAFLSESLAQIGAAQENISVFGVDGKYQTVCIIDTGVDYTHTNLGGCLGPNCKVLAGFDFINNDSDPLDDHGHGTHVAGIIVSNHSTYTGVASGANIVAIKALDSSGGGLTSTVIAGIEWCRANATAFNISIISMSLGGGLFTSYCDNSSDGNGLMAQVASAAAKDGIFVVASSGNSGSTTSLASPACGENVTAVASVNDASSGSLDSISSFSNRNSLLNLLAPGSIITSLNLGGGLTDKSGTSMAAPHVAAAAALLFQYSKQNNLSLTRENITQILNKTGKKIFDIATNLTFSRIDIRSALRELTSIPSLRINEVYPSPSSANTKWIEIYNNGTKDENLSGLIIGNLQINATISICPSSSQSPILRKGEWLIIIGNDSQINDITNLNTRYLCAGSNIFSSINDSSDMIYLYNKAGNIIHTIQYINAQTNKGFGFVPDFGTNISGSLSLLINPSPGFSNLCGYILNSNFNLETNTTLYCPRDGLIINTSNILLDCNQNMILGNISEGNFSGLIINPTQNVNITNCNITNFHTGALFISSSKNKINSSSIQNNIININFTNSNNNTIITNNLTSSTLYDIYLTSSKDNLFCQNKFDSAKTLGFSGQKVCIDIISPENSSNTSNSSLEFKFNISDIIFQTNCSLYLNNSLTNSTQILQEETNIITSNINNSKYNWHIICNDIQNNQGISNTFLFTNFFDNQPPNTSIQVVGELGSNSFYLSSLNLSFICQDALSNCQSTTTCIDQENSCIPNSTQTSYLLSDDGIYFARFNSTDSSANKENIKNQTFKIDKTQPSINILNPISGFYNQTNLSINFTAFDINNIASCTLEFNQTNTTLTNCENITIFNLSEQNYTIKLYVTDLAGNKALSQSIIQIDLMPPTISLILSNASGLQATLKVETNKAAICRFGETDAQYDLLPSSLSSSSSNLIHTSTQAYSQGLHTFFVRCKDFSQNLMNYSNSTNITLTSPPQNTQQTQASGSSGGGGGGGGGFFKRNKQETLSGEQTTATNTQTPGPTNTDNNPSNTNSQPQQSEKNTQELNAQAQDLNQITSAAIGSNSKGKTIFIVVGIMSVVLLSTSIFLSFLLKNKKINFLSASKTIIDKIKNLWPLKRKI